MVRPNYKIPKGYKIYIVFIGLGMTFMWFVETLGDESIKLLVKLFVGALSFGFLMCAGVALFGPSRTARWMSMIYHYFMAAFFVFVASNGSSDWPAFAIAALIFGAIGYSVQRWKLIDVTEDEG